MGASFRRIPRAPLSHLGSFRTYRGRAIADINGNPQSISPKASSGYLPGGLGPPAPPGPSFQICGIDYGREGSREPSDADVSHGDEIRNARGGCDPTGASEEAGRFASDPLQASQLLMGTIMPKGPRC